MAVREPEVVEFGEPLLLSRRQPDAAAAPGRDPFAGAPVSGQYDWTYRGIDAERWANLYGIAHHRGAFGVPTFFVGDAMYWGNDRIAVLRHALRRA